MASHITVYIHEWVYDVSMLLEHFNRIIDLFGHFFGITFFLLNNWYTNLFFILSPWSIKYIYDVYKTSATFRGIKSMIYSKLSSHTHTHLNNCLDNVFTIRDYLCQYRIRFCHQPDKHTNIYILGRGRKVKQPGHRQADRQDKRDRKAQQ